MSALQDRVFIVTGASKGFGLAIVQKLLAEGAKVGMIARGEQGLQNAVEQLQAGEAVFTQAASVDDQAAMKTAVGNIAEHFGRLDGIVNNAGIARPSRLIDASADEIMQQLSINIAGVLYGVQAAVPYLTQDNPRIINISSASAVHFDEMAHLGVYAASKCAVERLSRELRTELQEENIAVTVIRPGAAATDFAAEFDGEKLIEAVGAWQKTGPTMDTGMEVGHVAEAVSWCLQLPKGVASDVLEIRPNQATPKFSF